MRAVYMKTNSFGTMMNTSRDAHSTQLFAYFSYRYLMTLIDSFSDSYSALIIFYLFVIFSHCAVGDGCILVILMSYI